MWGVTWGVEGGRLTPLALCYYFVIHFYDRGTTIGFDVVVVFNSLEKSRDPFPVIPTEASTCAQLRNLRLNWWNLRCGGIYDLVFVVVVFVAAEFITREELVVWEGSDIINTTVSPHIQ
jgi:hypothetical protein